MSDLRFDLLTQKWTIIAPERCKRPSDFDLNISDRDPSRCPFCIGNEHLTPAPIMTINDNTGEKWQLRVFPNKYPILKVEKEISRKAHGIFDTISGVGAHEVIVETPDHHLKMADYTEDIYYRLFNTFQNRMQDLKGDKRLRYMIPIKNYGQTSGATLIHPHSQLIAMPEIPSSIQTVMAAAREHFERKERCLFCDTIDQEIADKERIISENQDYIAFCPFAATSPFEIRIFPKKHNHDFTTEDNKSMKSFASIALDVFRRLDFALKDISLNFYIQTAPFNTDTVERDSEDLSRYYHWYMEIVPRLSKIAGFEFGTGISINTVPPEEAAQYLKKVKK